MCAFGNDNDSAKRLLNLYMKLLRDLNAKSMIQFSV